MGIIQITTDVAGQINVHPRRVKIITTDNLATITTAAYLNPISLEGYTIDTTDVFDIVYGFSTVTKLGTYEIFTCTIVNGVITLVQWANPGDVLLPVVSGDFANFNGTSGQISDAGFAPSNAAKTTVVMANGATVVNHIMVSTDTTGTSGNLTGTAINSGSIQAGLSGTAGTLISYPATGAKGSLIIAGVANTGNTTTTVSNVAMGQASVISIPDPAAATADFVLAPAALVSGNLVSASGTAGLVADAGVTAAAVSGAVTQLGQLHQISVTLSASQVIASYATPVVLIPAVAGSVAIVHSANVYTASTGNTPFTTGVAPIIQYGVTVHGAGTIAVGTGLVTGDITAATSQVRTIGAAATAVYTGITNTAIAFSCTTAYTAGTGTTVTFTLVYELITASV